MNVDAHWIEQLFDDLAGHCRSLAGPGTRATLDRLAAELPLQRHSVATGEQVLDWVVPDEWTLRRATLTHVDTGRRILDTDDSFLHVVSHSVPVSTRISLEELQRHLHSLPDRPDVIPYRTTYYVEAWGLCLPDAVRATLPDGDYDVTIDAIRQPGELQWGEVLIPGLTSDEILLTTHVCHPTMFNDNMSGIAALAAFAHRLLDGPQRRLTVRCLFIPGTLGSIAFLAKNDDVVQRIRHGLVLTGLGDTTPFTYKRSRRGGTTTDRVVEHLVARQGGSAVDFSPYGYDERQFCSPGYDLAVGRLSRSVMGFIPEYHTSADVRSFVSTERILEAVELVSEIVDLLDANQAHTNLCPYGEPQLGRRQLYTPVGGAISGSSNELALLWLLSASDGATDLISIAEQSGVPWRVLAAAAEQLIDSALLARSVPNSP